MRCGTGLIDSLYCNSAQTLQQPAGGHKTSGGLLLAAAPQDAAALEQELRAAGLPAAIVGEIFEKQTTEITVNY